MSTKTNYTAKQKKLMAMWQTNRLKRINLLEGSVSSGKTWISLVLWAFWVKSMPQDKLYMMCAKSLTALKRNCLLLLSELVGENNFQFSTATKEGELFGRRILFEGAYDARSEAKIRGLTLQGAYCDELTQFPEDFFTMLLSRLRLPGAKLIATTNPDSPSHWLKTNYINRKDELSFMDMKFLLDDNTTLPADYIENVKREYTGVFYDRFILGRWVLAEGLIYPMYEQAIEAPPKGQAERYVVSVDYGTLNAFAAMLWGKYGNVWYAIDGYYYSGRDTGSLLTDEQYCDEMVKRFSKYGNEYYKLKTIVDPSAASFITALRKRRIFAVIHANNDVIDGIRNTATALQLGWIKVSPALKWWAKEAAGYVWADSETDDRPVKVNDHCLTGDTLVYTENGYIPICELVGKDGKVWSFNVNTQQAELKRFTDCRKTQKNAPIYKITLADGKTVRCTGEHPILTECGYMQARYLAPKDKVMQITGAAVEVKSIEFIGLEDVYNMEVADNHNFAVNGGIVVHNCMDATRYFVQTMGLYHKQRTVR